MLRTYPCMVSPGFPLKLCIESECIKSVWNQLFDTPAQNSAGSIKKRLFLVLLYAAAARHTAAAAVSAAPDGEKRMEKMKYDIIPSA